VVSGSWGRAGFAFRFDYGRSASWGDRLRGWGDIDLGADASVFAAVNVGRLELLAEAIHQLGAADGTLLTGTISTKITLPPRVFLTVATRVAWADSRYNAGFHDASLSLNAVYVVDKHWSLNGHAQAGLLLGDAAGSPLTEQRFQPVFGGFFGYTF
jgi:outer membrane scaffolding protein for murein synthesis (MipA/OmpV family)